MSFTGSAQAPAPSAVQSPPLAPSELQARLARAYLSGDGAEVERVLALVAEANYALPPKTDRAA